MNKNFKESIKNNFGSDTKKESEKKEYNSGTGFILKKKQEDKVNKKPFNVYMENNLVKDLDRISKKSGYSRNELINKMCSWCVENLQFRE